MSESIQQESAFNRLCFFWETGISNHVEKVNKLIPELLEQFDPDQLIKISPYVGSESLLHILAYDPGIDYQWMFL